MLRLTISRFPAISPATLSAPFPATAFTVYPPPSTLYNTLRYSLFFSSDSHSNSTVDFTPEPSPSKQGNLKSGLYLVGTPIGNLEDITLRALRVLKSADVILAEDTRHSGKLLQHYSIKTPLLSYHKFNEAQREQSILKRLNDGEIVALISDAGTPGISDPGSELVFKDYERIPALNGLAHASEPFRTNSEAKLCVEANISVIPIPGPCAFVSALSASGLSTVEFAFVGFLPKNASARRDRLTVSANEAATQIFYVPPHKLSQFLEECSDLFSETRRCVMAREITKMHEEFWRGTLCEAKAAFLDRQPKGEITFLIEGKPQCEIENPSESQLENDLESLISNGHTLSTAVKLVAAGSSMKKKTIYSIALKKFGKQTDAVDDVDRSV